MADIIRPTITLANGATYDVHGIDASTPMGTKLEADFDRAPSPEDVVRVVWEALDARHPMFVSDVHFNRAWVAFNPELILGVSCLPFD